MPVRSWPRWSRYLPFGRSHLPRAVINGLLDPMATRQWSARRLWTLVFCGLALACGARSGLDVAQTATRTSSGGNAASGGDYAWVDPSLSQWYNACTSHNENGFAYPYGLTYQPEACNGADHSGVSRTVPVGTLTECQSQISGYAGVFDLGGNVAEWEDACDDDSYCRTRGGDFLVDADALVCSVDSSAPRDSQFWNRGFRCCS